MKTYKERINECIEYLDSIRFPGKDWKDDKLFYDQLEKEFSEIPEEEEVKAMHTELMSLIQHKRMVSLNCNKTSEELYAGWNDD